MAEFSPGTGGSRRCCLLPPGEVRIGRGSSIVPLVSFLRKLKELGVTIAEDHVEPVLSPVIMPLAPRIILVAVRPPRQVALDKLVGRAARNFARFHWLGFGRG